ncbi:hydroxyisourate hydrolase [Brachybacterium vulturis]|uniref:5-hydroxyisourate hydrolase n=1 Tax=Brachybacterium vulturis TaxID=2017484 RepID=A0A291GR74_9MICO|nr:hydroxyisourate hydrolase [Brachybacterium vulturis]ATG52741.1 hydroxyisourate hydrolase [Brachybacterium vulturis]
MSHLTAHVLDTMTGTPATGILLHLDTAAGERIASATTDADGRARELGPAVLDPGEYRITFRTGEYFAARGQETFFPRVTVDFTVAPDQDHYHVPLLLSPFAFSTYRGS